MSKNNNPIIKSENDRVVWGTLIAVTVGILVWTCILVYGIKEDVKHIKKTLLNIQETLEPIEHINDPTGLIQHMGSKKPLQQEYPEANFHNTKVPVFNLYRNWYSIETNDKIKND